MSTGFRRLLVAVVAILAIATLARAYLSWINYGAIDEVSGVWSGLAWDLKNGVFYRPVFSELGFGGTRYSPLYFTLHAAIASLGIDFILAGMLLSAISSLGLIAATFLLIRKLEVERTLAACAAMLILVSVSFHWALTTIRGDALSAALNILGLALCVGLTVKRRHIVMASILFALAFSTKITTVFGVFAAFLYYLLNGPRRRAWDLLVLATISFGLAMAIIYIASQGRIWGILQTSAGGGTSLMYLLKAPSHAIQVLNKDMGGLLVFFLGLVITLYNLKNYKSNIGVILFLSTLAATVIIYGSPGTDYNHLLDITAASLIYFAWWLSRQEKNMFNLGLAALIVAGLISLQPILYDIYHNKQPLSFTSRPRYTEYQEIVDFIKTTDGPILSDHSMIPIILKQTPYVLDWYMLATMAIKNPDIIRPLYDRIIKKQFAVAVFTRPGPSLEDVYRPWNIPYYFSDTFIETFLKNYRVALKTRSYIVYTPRRG